MVYVAGGLVVLVALLVVVLYRQQISHLNSLALIHARAREERAEILSRGEAERRSLLDRIQHPEVFQPAALTHAPLEPPRDAQEMAAVGQTDGSDPMDWIGQEVPGDVMING